MKLKKIVSLVLAASLTLTGCSVSDIIETDEQDTTGEVETVEDGFYILTADGQYYQTNTDNQSFNKTTDQADKSRYTWTANNNKAIPTLYADDNLVLYLSTAPEEMYIVEEFKPSGYTVGVANLSLDTSGQIVITGSNLLAGSNMYDTCYDTLKNGKVNFVLAEVNGETATKDSLTYGGCIKGLEKGETVTLGCYKGTYYGDLKVTADTRVFSSYKTSYTAGYTPTKDGYVIVNLGTVEEGYYAVDGGGIFYYDPLENRPATEEE